MSKRDTNDSSRYWGFENYFFLRVIFTHSFRQFTPGFSGVRVTRSLDLCVCYVNRCLFVCLYVFFWPLCCLFFFDIRILINLLVSSNSSSTLILECIYNTLLQKAILIGLDDILLKFFKLKHEKTKLNQEK